VEAKVISYRNSKKEKEKGAQLLFSAILPRAD